MKKILTMMSVGLLVLCLGVGLTACGAKKFTVTFDKNATGTVTDMPVAIKNVTKDATIDEPVTEPKRDDFIFDGWYKEKACTNKWVFVTEKVTKNVTLYAKWVSAASVSVPGEVADFFATPSWYSVALSWGAPSNDGGLLISGYEVTNDDWDTYYETSELTYTFDDLIDGTAYVFAVRAVNAVGAGAEVNQTVSTDLDVVPGVPTGLYGTVNSSTIQIDWTAPAANGGSAITNYIVEVWAGGTLENTYDNVVIAAAAFGSLTEGTEYTFKVWAVNAKGQSATAAITTVEFIHEEWLMARLWFWDGDDYVEYGTDILVQLYGSEDLLTIEVDGEGTTVADVIALYIELGGIQGGKITVGSPFLDEFAYGIASEVQALLGFELNEEISSELSGTMVAGGVILNLYFDEPEPSPYTPITSFPFSTTLNFSLIETSLGPNYPAFAFTFTLETETVLDIKCGYPGMNRYIRVYNDISLVGSFVDTCAQGNNIISATFAPGTYYMVVYKNGGPDSTETFSVTEVV